MLFIQILLVSEAYTQIIGVNSPRSMKLTYWSVKYIPLIMYTYLWEELGTLDPARKK